MRATSRKIFIFIFNEAKSVNFKGFFKTSFKWKSITYRVLYLNTDYDNEELYLK